MVSACDALLDFVIESEIILLFSASEAETDLANSFIIVDIVAFRSD
jgi:hypothetical protein